MADEDNARLDKLTDLLTRTAIALKGDPPELTSWSWHDLPVVAAQAREIARDGAAKIQMLVNALDAAGLLPEHVFTFPDGDTWEATDAVHRR